MKGTRRKVAVASAVLMGAATSATAQYVVAIVDPGVEFSGSWMSGGIVAGSYLAADGNYHAMLLDLRHCQMTDLNPPGCEASSLGGKVGSDCYGAVRLLSSGTNWHAAVWRDGALFDLNPTGFAGTSIMCGTLYGLGGLGTLPGEYLAHAAFWPAPEAPMADLSPSWAYQSFVQAIDGPFQYGEAQPGQYTSYHSLRWQGTPDSAVIIDPPGSYSSWIESGNDGVQVGDVTWNWNYPEHACLWRGTAESAIDLNPPGMTESRLALTTGTVHGGYMYKPSMGGYMHAALWTGTSTDVIDLDNFLTQIGSFQDSYITAIDPASLDVLGYVKYPRTTVLWHRADSSETLKPLAMSVQIGKLVSGTVRSLLGIDSDQVVCQRFLVPNSASPFIRFTVDFRATLRHPTMITSALTCRTYWAGDGIVSVSLHSFLTGKDDFQLKVSRTDMYSGTFHGLIVGDLSEYVSSDGSMKAVVEVRKPAPSVYGIDQVTFDMLNLQTAQ